jgi:hypothetical protein
LTESVRGGFHSTQEGFEDFPVTIRLLGHGDVGALLEDDRLSASNYPRSSTPTRSPVVGPRFAILPPPLVGRRRRVPATKTLRIAIGLLGAVLLVLTLGATEADAATFCVNDPPCLFGTSEPTI